MIVKSTSTEIEREAKCLLSKQDYEKILNGFRILEKSTHVNHYFDTKHFNIFKLDGTLRVRENSDLKYRLDLKIKEKYDEGFEEYQAPFLKNFFNILCNQGFLPTNEVKKKLASVIDIREKLLLHTNANVFRIALYHDYGPNVRLCLDKSIFKNKKLDHDFEVESDISYKHACEVKSQILRIHNIEDNVSESKYSRALRYLRE